MTTKSEPRPRSEPTLTMIAIRFWPDGVGGPPSVDYHLVPMLRVPFVGECIYPGGGDAAAFSDGGALYRVTRVVHLITAGDDGRVAEVDAARE